MEGEGAFFARIKPPERDINRLSPSSAYVTSETRLLPLLYAFIAWTGPSLRCLGFNPREGLLL